MTLKCSVFGHQFEDAEVTREREEQGSEVVITITETETCSRCGETRVVSENKEVTTLETPSDIVGEDIDADDESDGPDEDERGTQSPETSTEATTAAGASTGGGDVIQDAEGTTPPDGDSTGTTADLTGGRDPDEEDAVILDDEDDTEERAPGEWPQDAEDERDDDWTPETETAPGELPDVETEQPDVQPTGEAVTVPDGEFHCPECGFTTAVESSSLRAGDFCPECHRGALTHEPGE